MTENGKPAEETSQPSSRRSRLGFMKGCKVPYDFDTMYQAEIEEMFYGSPIEPRTGGEETPPNEPCRKS